LRTPRRSTEVPATIVMGRVVLSPRIMVPTGVGHMGRRLDLVSRGRMRGILRLRVIAVAIPVPLVVPILRPIMIAVPVAVSVMVVPPLGRKRVATPVIGFVVVLEGEAAEAIVAGRIIVVGRVGRITGIVIVIGPQQLEAQIHVPGEPYDHPLGRRALLVGAEEDLHIVIPAGGGPLLVQVVLHLGPQHGHFLRVQGPIRGGLHHLEIMGPGPLGDT